ncbi:FMN-binding negative transcriptional regulator [Nonomuraea sp. NPDC049480]|uniref:FMN-binding negative transcriptional regulator n=1 Tax=Nonomuraea sp. NPDC049480 TaxID=3364353 RepID=UPI00378E3B3C
MFIQPPIAVPTHFACDGHHLLTHLARPNPVWKAIEHDPNVVFTVIGDYAFIPGPRRTKAGTPPTDGVPTSYYTAVQFTCRAGIVADHLTARGQGLDVPTARQQRRRLDRIGPWKP